MGEPYLVPQASYSRLVDPTGGRSLPQPLEMICSAPDGDFVAHATKVHETGIPWDDPSGDHLRECLRVSREAFYDPSSFALVPMGFCYPGKAKSGDAPPRPECAPQWHERVLDAMAPDPLLLLCGQYAQAHYLGASRKKSLTETVRSFADFGPRTIPLPHPSWRSRIWMKKNPWFEAKLLPVLRRRVKKRLQD